MNRDVTVREVMDREFVGVSESDEVLESAELLLREDADTAVVLRGSDPVGVLDDRDVLSLLVDGGDPATSTVGDVMTESVPTVEPEQTISEARDRMSSWSTSLLIVSEGGEPHGIVTEHDILATSTLGSEAVATEEETRKQRMRERIVTAADTATDADEEDVAENTFGDQSICEKCGSLAHDLSGFNGQLLCGDCRDI